MNKELLKAEEPISVRERAVIEALVKGHFSNKQIALWLGVEETTVKTHLNRIAHKFRLEIKSRTELAVRIWQCRGWFERRGRRYEHVFLPGLDQLTDAEIETIENERH